MTGKVLNVVVLSGEGPDDFYVMQEKSLTLEMRLQKILKEEAEKASQPEEIKVDETYLAQHPADKQWYRVKVIKAEGNGQFFQVFLIDYGNVFRVADTKIRSFDWIMIRDMEPLAIKCCLEDKQELLKDIYGVNLRFQFLVAHRQLLKMIIKGREGRMLIVDLITIDRVQNYSITDFLLCIDGSLVERSVDCEVKPLPTYDLYDSVEIIVRHVKSPSEFYVSMTELSPDEHAMRERMKNFYFNNQPNFTLFVVGTICAMAENNEWHRVEILTSPNHEKKCKVQFVDTGKEFWALYDELFELDKQFYEYERFAWRCCLADIEPIFKPWPDATTSFFRNRLMNCDCPVEVKVIEGTKDKVKVFAYFEGLKININQSLVFFKLAKLSSNANAEPYFEEIFKGNCTLDETVQKKLHLVELVDFKSPFDFQLKFSEFHRPIKTMTKLLQKYVPKESSEVAWQVGDKCLVKCKVKVEDKSAWHRGCITNMNMKAHVELLDYGTQIAASLRKLHKCPPEFAMMNSTIEKAHMACTKEREWSEDDGNEANKIVKSYGKFFATFKDNNTIQLSKDDDGPRPVVLWGKNENLQKQNIVQELEYKRLVVSTYKEKSTEDDLSNMPFLDFSKIEGNVLKKELEELHEQAERSAFVKGSTIEIGNHRVMLKKSRVNQWKEVEPMTDISFTAMPTFVDNDGNIILHDYACETDLTLMNNTINNFFQGLSRKRHSFKVGDPCLVLYESDARFYRGTVVEILADECSVKFIDYGNTQRSTQFDKLYSEVICWEVPPFAHKYRLYGSPMGQDGEINQELFNMMHQQMVDNNMEIRIDREEAAITDPNISKLCWINHKGNLIKTYDDFLVYMKENCYVSP